MHGLKIAILDAVDIQIDDFADVANSGQRVPISISLL
jgi:hypothetical protein